MFDKMIDDIARKYGHESSVTISFCNMINRAEDFAEKENKEISLFDTFLIRTVYDLIN